MAIREIEGGGGTIITPPHVDLYRMLALKYRLKLEIQGIRFQGRTVYSIVRDEFGFRGSREKCLVQLEAKIEEYKAAHPADEEA